MRCASHRVIDVLIEFPATTWLVALVYQVVIALVSGHGCVNDHHLSLLFNIVVGVNIVYLGLRCFLFYVLIGKGRKHAWPGQGFDRTVSFLATQGSVGFVPWLPHPSRNVAIAVQQSWLFFNLQRIAFLLVNTEGTLYSSKPHDLVLLDVALTPLFLVLYTTLVWPFWLEICSLPPFASPAETERHVVATLTALAHRDGEARTEDPSFDQPLAFKPVTTGEPQPAQSAPWPASRYAPETVQAASGDGCGPPGAVPPPPANWAASMGRSSVHPLPPSYSYAAAAPSRPPIDYGAVQREIDANRAIIASLQTQVQRVGATMPPPPVQPQLAAGCAAMPPPHVQPQFATGYPIRPLPPIALQQQGYAPY